MLKKYGSKRISHAGLLFVMLIFALFLVRTDAHAAWKKNSDGTLSWYVNGVLSRNQWVSPNYYVDANGRMHTGWLYKGGKWYYFSRSGKMLRSTWLKSGGKMYYAGSSGAMYTDGIYKIGSYSYCFNSRGVRLTGKQTVNQKTYFFSTVQGIMVKSRWLTLSKKSYFFGSDGAMCKNQWVGRYYVGSDGARLTSQWKDNRYLGSDGQAVKGLQKIGGKYYFFNTKTYVKVTNYTLKIGSYTYRFDSKGVGTIIEKNGVELATVSVESTYYTDKVLSDETLLATIIYCEAGNQPYSGQLAVGLVILNRMNDSRFPSKMREVVYQKNQFTPARDGSLTRAIKNPSLVSANCRQAASTLMKLNVLYQKGLKPALKLGNQTISFPYIFFMTNAAYKRLGLTAKYRQIGDHVFFTTWA